MRLKAVIPHHQHYQKAIIYALSSSDVYLFLYDTLEDASCRADFWFESVTDAQIEAEERVSVSPAAWKNIPDPLPGALHDWEQPTQALQGLLRAYM